MAYICDQCFICNFSDRGLFNVSAANYRNHSNVHHYIVYKLCSKTGPQQKKKRNFLGLLMIWIIRLFLLVYAVLYFGLGAWAIIDPVKDALELNNIPSFMDAVGLKVSAEIGYSEVAGLYGGINMIIGLLCLLGIFSRGITTFVLSLLAFLTFSIALGRYLFALIPSTPTFYNTFFIFEVVTFFLSLSFFIYMKYLYNPRKNANVENVAKD